MKIVFLGVGGTYPTKNRNVTSVAVQMQSEVLLFDCGEGIQKQLMQSSVSFMRITSVFISHLHADHFLGLPGLIQSMSLNGREGLLSVYGPEGTRRTVEGLLNLGYFKCAYPVEGYDLRGGESVEMEGYAVRTAEADHTVPCLAYSVEEGPRKGKFDSQRALSLGVPEGPLFRTLQSGKSVVVDGRQVSPSDVLGPLRKGRKFVYSGDTRRSETIIELATEADVLVHDSTLDERYSSNAAEFGHSTARQAAEVAKQARVKRLFLVHISPRYDTAEELVEEARKVFPEAHLPEELSEHEIRFED